MFKVIGADGREYGPATAEQLRQWIAEGRANAQTQAQAEGTTEWKPLSAFPEFTDAFGATAAGAGASVSPISIPANADAIAAEILARGYDLDVGSCFRRGWELVKANFWLLVGATFVAMLIANAWFFGLILGGPMMGGLCLLYLKRLRGEPAGFDVAFKGFSLAFAQLLLAYIVSALLSGLGFALCLLPGIYLTVAWMFALPLVIDRRLEFWAAMELSRKVVTRHWWTLFGLALLCAVVAVAGVLACFIGIFVTLPLAIGAMMYAYEDIFGSRSAPTA